MCYFQKSACDADGFSNSVAFLAFARDDTLSLLYHGINRDSVPDTSGGDVVWVERTPTCSNQSFLDVNVTLAQNGNLLAWSHGSSVVNPIDHSCTVNNIGREFTKFVPTSSVINSDVETFVSKRIASEELDCLAGP